MSEQTHFAWSVSTRARIRLLTAKESSKLDVLMKEVTSSNFGLLIAYLIPGFTALWGISYFSPMVQSWLNSSTHEIPVVGGFLYVTLASIAVGMIVNALRWMTLDRVHHATGIPYPDWDFSRLQDDLGAYSLLVEFYFRYHECFGNSLIAGTFSYSVWRYHHPGLQWLPTDILLVGLAVLLWAGSRDCLSKYYARTESLLRRKDELHQEFKEAASVKVKKSVESDLEE